MPLDLEAVLRQMVQERASDLFLAEGKVPSARVNGALRAIGREPVEREAL